jgi:hypothetical protein
MSSIRKGSWFMGTTPSSKQNRSIDYFARDY